MSVQEHVITALAAAIEGDHVLFFADSMADSRAMFNAVDSLAPAGCEVRRANGQESIRTSAGGSVHFRSIRSHGHRGMSVCRVYVPANVSDEVLRSIAPCLTTCQDGRLISYFSPSTIVSQRKSDDRVRTGRFTSQPKSWVNSPRRERQAAKWVSDG